MSNCLIVLAARKGRRRALLALLAVALLAAGACRAQEISSTDNGATAQTLAASEPPPQQQQEAIPGGEQAAPAQQQQQQQQQQQEQSQQQTEGSGEQQQQLVVATTFRPGEPAAETQTAPSQPAATESPSVQAEVGTFASGGSASSTEAAGEAGQPAGAQQQQQQQQVDQQVDQQQPQPQQQQAGFARDAPQGIVMRESALEQSQNGEQQQQQQQLNQVATSGVGAPARANKPGRLGKRVYGGHAGVFGRKRVQSEQQQQQQQQPAAAVVEQARKKNQRQHHHYYYNTLNSKQAERPAAAAQRRPPAAPLKAADFPEDYREILVQPDQLAAGQEYEVQRQQTAASARPAGEEARQEAVKYEEPQQQQTTKVTESELAGGGAGEPESATQTSGEPQQQQQQQQTQQTETATESPAPTTSDQQGFDHPDETSTAAPAAAAATPYIRLSSVATINATNASSYGQAPAAPPSEMKLMRIYVIDLDQKLVVGNGAGPSYAGEQASTPAAPVEQTRLSVEAAAAVEEQQQQQTVAVYASTAMPALAEEPQQQQQQQQQSYSPAAADAHSSPAPYGPSSSSSAPAPAPTTSAHQHDRQQVLVLPRASHNNNYNNNNAKQNDEFVLLDRESLHANLSQIMAQMGHYQPQQAASSYAPPSSPPPPRAYPANHQPQNYSGAPAPPVAAHYKPAGHYNLGLAGGGGETAAPALGANRTGAYANNTAARQLQAYLGGEPAPGGKAARAGEQSAGYGAPGNWTLTSETLLLPADYGAAQAHQQQQQQQPAPLKQSVAYPALVQHPERPRQQQHAQFAAVYPAASVPQYIAPQYGGGAAANASAPVWAQQVAAGAANYSAGEQFASEWPQQLAAGHAPPEQANYSTAPFYSAGPGELEQQQQQQQQAAKYQAQQHLFAYAAAAAPAEFAGAALYQQHPIGPSHYGEPGQQQPATRLAAGAPDGHWRPVDLASPFDSYGAQAAQRPAPRPINGPARAAALQQQQQHDHDVVSLSALLAPPPPGHYGQQAALNQSGPYAPAAANGTAHLGAYKPANEPLQVGYAPLELLPTAAGANYENGSLGAALQAEPAPSQQVHGHQVQRHPSSSAPGAHYNGTAGAQMTTTDYHQLATLAASAAPPQQLGVTNEFGGLLAGNQQPNYTSKRYPTKAGDQSTSAASNGSSGSSEEAPKIPQSYSSAPPAAGSQRRPSYAPGANYTTSAELASEGGGGGEHEPAAEGEPADAADEGYESAELLEAGQAHASYAAGAAQRPGGKQASAKYAPKRPAAGKHKQRPPKLPYGGDSEAAALYHQQQQQAEGAEQHQAMLEGATGYQARPAPQGLRQYLSSVAAAAAGGGGGGGDALLSQGQQPYAQPLQHRPPTHLYRYPTPGVNPGAVQGARSLLSWETLSSVASGAAKRLPTALSSFLSPFGMGPAAGKSPPLYPTAQTLGFHHQQLAGHPANQAHFIKSAHYNGDVANFHRPYPFRHMSAPESYSDGGQLGAHHAGQQQQQQQQQHHESEPASGGGGELADEYGEELNSSASSSESDNHSVQASNLTAAAAGAHEPPPAGDAGEVVADLASIRPDGKPAAKAKRPGGLGAKTKGKRPAKPVISSGETQPAGGGGAADKEQPALEPAQVAVLSSIEQQLEQQQQQQAHKIGGKARRRPKKARPAAATAAGELNGGAYQAESAGESPSQGAHQAISLESLSLEQQRALLLKASQLSGGGLAPPAAGKLQQVPAAPGGLLFAPDAMGALAPHQRPPGFNSMQIGQFKITPQTQFVQSIIEPSRQMLGQYFKQYIGQLGQLG